MACYMNMIRRKFISVNAIEVTPLESTTMIDYVAMRADLTVPAATFFCLISRFKSQV
jgi:hypothetical protein